MDNNIKTGNWKIIKNNEAKRLTYTSDKDGTTYYQGSAPSYVQDADIVYFILNRLTCDIGDRITLSNGNVFSYGKPGDFVIKA